MATKRDEDDRPTTVEAPAPSSVTVERPAAEQVTPPETDGTGTNVAPADVDDTDENLDRENETNGDEGRSPR